MNPAIPASLPVLMRAAAIALLPAIPAPAADKTIPCLCRAFGKDWNQGDRVCFGGAIRICGMSGNVTSWITTSESCPSA